jgi:rubrerythrin
MTEKDKEINELRREVARLRKALEEAEPKSGRWEKDSDAAFYWKCSNCGAYLFWRKEEYLLRQEDKPNYCPNCGAKMDLDEVEE